MHLDGTCSFYWTTFVLLEILSLLYICPKIACLTYRVSLDWLRLEVKICYFGLLRKQQHILVQVHETIFGRNSPSLNGEDHHLVSQSNSKTCWKYIIE